MNEVSKLPRYAVDRRLRFLFIAASIGDHRTVISLSNRSLMLTPQQAPRPNLIFHWILIYRERRTKKSLQKVSEDENLKNDSSRDFDEHQANPRTIERLFIRWGA